MSKLYDQIKAAAAFPSLTHSNPIAFDGHGEDVFIYSESGFEEVIKRWEYEDYLLREKERAQSFFKALEGLNSK